MVDAAVFGDGLRARTFAAAVILTSSLSGTMLGTSSKSSLIGTESAGGFWMTAAILALLLALASSGAAVFLYQQVQLTVKDLNQADARLVSLENKLLSTDESMSESSDMMRIKINEMAKQLDVNFSPISLKRPWSITMASTTIPMCKNSTA